MNASNIFIQNFSFGNLGKIKKIFWLEKKKSFFTCRLKKSVFNKLSDQSKYFAHIFFFCLFEVKIHICFFPYQPESPLTRCRKLPKYSFKFQKVRFFQKSYITQVVNTEKK